MSPLDEGKQGPRGLGPLPCELVCEKGMGSGGEYMGYRETWGTLRVWNGGDVTNEMPSPMPVLAGVVP